MESKQKTRARSSKNKSRKSSVGDKSRSGTDGVLGDVWSRRCNAEPARAAGPPEVRWSGCPGSVTGGVSPALLCWAQSALAGRLPSTAAL